MNFQDIFTTYYTLYRAEVDIPQPADDEFKVAVPLANVAIRRWANYDATYWKELFTTAQIDGGGDLVVTSSITYACSTNMQEAAGIVKLRDPNTAALLATIPIVEPQDVQFMNDASTYAFFTGSPNAGFTLTLNPPANMPLLGATIDYVFYKKPTLIQSDGSGIPDMSDTDYIVHNMLANRFRGSRNPYYQSAKTDAEDSLRSMQANNNSGTWADPWSVPDNSGSSWGQ